MSEAYKFEEDDFIKRSEFEYLKDELNTLKNGVQLNSGQLEKVSIIAFSGSLDKVLASFIIATGAAASGMDVTLFFTFWGISALKKEKMSQPKKTILERMFGWMLPRGFKGLPLSQLNMHGMGPMLMKQIMAQKNISSLEDMIEASEALGVKIGVCEMTMDLMGIKKSELRDYPGLELCGVTKVLEDASKGKVTLFI